MSAPVLDRPRAGRPTGSTPRLAPRREERGLTWIGFLLLVAVVAGAYLAWVWVPVYFENYAVKQTVRDYMNQAIKNHDDARLVANMVAKIRSLSDVEGVDEWGRPALVPAVPLLEGDVSWVRDTTVDPPVLRVSFDYARDVTYPVLERRAVKVFTVSLENTLTVPNWGPPR